MASAKRRSSEKAAIDRRCVDVSTHTARLTSTTSGVGASSLVDLKAQYYKTQEEVCTSTPHKGRHLPQARQAREAGINPAERRRKPSDALGDSNTGVGERDRKDRLHVKVRRLRACTCAHAAHRPLANKPPRATPHSSARPRCMTGWLRVATTATTTRDTTSTFSTRRRTEVPQRPSQSTTRAPGCHSSLGEGLARHQTPWGRRRVLRPVREVHVWSYIGSNW